MVLVASILSEVALSKKRLVQVASGNDASSDVVSTTSNLDVGVAVMAEIAVHMKV